MVQTVSAAVVHVETGRWTEFRELSSREVDQRVVVVLAAVKEEAGLEGGAAEVLAKVGEAAREEHACRFCGAVYPSWKESLTPAHLQPAIPVVSVHYNGICYRLRVQPGPEGFASFQRQLQKITGLHAEVLDCMQITFQCRAPDTSQELSFKGISAFDAAIHCASISAAERMASQKGSSPGLSSVKEVASEEASPRSPSPLPHVHPEEHSRSIGSQTVSDESANPVTTSGMGLDPAFLSHDQRQGGVGAAAPSHLLPLSPPSPAEVRSRSMDQIPPEILLGGQSQSLPLRAMARDPLRHSVDVASIHESRRAMPVIVEHVLHVDPLPASSSVSASSASTSAPHRSSSSNKQRLLRIFREFFSFGHSRPTVRA